MDFNSEQRSKTRTPCDVPINILLDGSTNNSEEALTVQVVDISSTGMGIKMEAGLKKGQTIVFQAGQPNWDLPSKGLVVWSFKQDSSYRAGLEFIL